MAPRRLKPRSFLVGFGLTLLIVVATYKLSYAVRDLQVEVKGLQKAIEEEVLALQTARTNRAYLTRPDRLVVQASSLGMVPGRGSQIVDIAQIPPASQIELARTPLPALLPSGAMAVLMVRPMPDPVPMKGKTR